MITPENTATPAALSSSDYVSLIVREHLVITVVAQGYSILLSGDVLFSHLSISFEFHDVTVCCPLKLNIVVIYRPPGAFVEFLNELDTLISSFISC